MAGARPRDLVIPTLFEVFLWLLMGALDLVGPRARRGVAPERTAAGLVASARLLDQLTPAFGGAVRTSWLGGAPYLAARYRGRPFSLRWVGGRRFELSASAPRTLTLRFEQRGPLPRLVRQDGPGSLDEELTADAMELQSTFGLDELQAKWGRLTASARPHADPAVLRAMVERLLEVAWGDDLGPQGPLEVRPTPGSALLRCPFCHHELAQGEERTLCGACAAAHHAPCFAEHEGCAIAGCASAPPARREPA